MFVYLSHREVWDSKLFNAGIVSLHASVSYLKYLKMNID